MIILKNKKNARNCANKVVSFPIRIPHLDITPKAGYNML